jgi:NADPH2:quinone reductase
MKAMIIETYGNPDVFLNVELPKPTMKDNEVLIQVAATSVNPVDCKIRSGAFAGLGADLPALLHGDVAGTVVEVGKQVSQFKIGDEVYGCAGGFKGLNGALAEYMPADARLLAHKPKTLSMAKAAALPLVSITAWEALVNKTNVRKGQRVLIHAGTGGVGHIAIQLAKHLGATVYTTCSSPEKMVIAEKLGADYVINYKKEDVDSYVKTYTEGQGFDVVFDTVGEDVFTQSMQAAGTYGQVVTILAAATYDLTPFFFKGLSLHAVLMPIPLLSGVGREAYGQILAQVAKLVDANHIQPLLDPLDFKIEEVAKAHAHLESGRAVGKVVLSR